MLQTHFRNEEASLMKQAEKAGIFSSPNNIGKAREVFVDSFLKNNLPAKLKIWSGEIIDYTTTPSNNIRRNQRDLCIVREDVPVILPDGKTAMMPLEAVLASIEVKSTLNKEHLFEALSSIQNLRLLKRAPEKASLRFGNVPPRVINFIFSYKGVGPKTLIDHLKNYSKENKIPNWNLFDVLTVLGTYTVVKIQGEKNGGSYCLFEQDTDNLFLFMKFLYFSSSGFIASPPSIQPYFENRSPKGKMEPVLISQ